MCVCLCVCVCVCVSVSVCLAVPALQHHLEFVKQILKLLVWHFISRLEVVFLLLVPLSYLVLALEVVE